MKEGLPITETKSDVASTLDNGANKRKIALKERLQSPTLWPRLAADTTIFFSVLEFINGHIDAGIAVFAAGILMQLGLDLKTREQPK